MHYYLRFLFLVFIVSFGCSRQEYVDNIPYSVPIQPYVVPEYSDYPPAALPEEPVPLIKPSTIAPLVVIDAGHGGKDLGTESTKDPKYQEKILNLATAKFLGQYLQKMGYRIVMLRRDDTFISLEKRAEVANSLKPALFVSVHYNSAPSEQASGIEVFYYKSENDKARTIASKKLGEEVLRQVLAQTNAKSRGVKHGNLAVVRETNMPAILIEGGFLTNREERNNILTSAYQKKIAIGIAQGVDKYLKDKKT